MDFFEAAANRRSVRKFRETPVRPDDLERILHTSSLAPSAGNLQAYEIWVVTDAEKRSALARAAFDQESIRQAPVALVFCADPEIARKYGERGTSLYAVQDATVAVAYAQIAATTLGLATCWVGSFDEDKVAQLVGVEAPRRPIAILPTGYGDEAPAAPPRRPLSQLVHRT